MELADEGGIESLTMRELGRRLGVEAASLYNHVKGKDDLLDGMADLAAGEIDVPSDVVDQSSLALPEGVDTFDVAEEILTTIPSDAYPSLMRIAGDFVTNPHDEAAVFGFGLGLILGGLQRQLESD